MLLVVVCGCQALEEFGDKFGDRFRRRNDEPEVTYIPGFRRVVPITEGEPSPITGFGIPPALMADIGDCLSESLKQPGFELGPLKPFPDLTVPDSTVPDSMMLDEINWQMPTAPVPTWVEVRDSRFRISPAS